MSETDDNSAGGAPSDPAGDAYSEKLPYAPVGALVPDSVAAGVFSTGAVALEGPEEFIIDFLQAVTRPPRVGARVVMTPRVMGQFIEALKDNLGKYEGRFGPPKPLPQRDPKARPDLREMYNDLRLADSELSGAYATAVMIGHSPSEFFFDFITRFFPRAAVSSRVYMSASQVPHVLATLTKSLENRRGRGPSQPPGAAPGSDGQRTGG